VPKTFVSSVTRFHLCGREPFGQAGRNCSCGTQPQEQHDRSPKDRDRRDRVERKRRADEDHEREQVRDHLRELDRALACLLDLVRHQFLEMPLAVLGLKFPGAEHVGADQAPPHRGLDVAGDHGGQPREWQLHEQTNEGEPDPDEQDVPDRCIKVDRAEGTIDLLPAVDERRGRLRGDREQPRLADRRDHRACHHPGDEPKTVADQHLDPVPLRLLQRPIPVVHEPPPGMGHRRRRGGCLDRGFGVLSQSGSPSGRAMVWGWRCPARDSAPPAPASRKVDDIRPGANSAPTKVWAPVTYAEHRPSTRCSSGPLRQKRLQAEDVTRA
jgi:hypothetical protein